MESLSSINSMVNSIVWGTPMIMLLLGTGIVLTLVTKGIQFIRFPFAIRQVLGKTESTEASEGTVSSIQALATSLSATVGVGNIAGVSTAIVLGGPGAVLWVFLSGLLGMATKFCEIAVALEYRERDEHGIMRGGAMYVLSKAFNMHWFGIVFAVLCSMAAFGIGNMIQANSVADVMSSTFNINPHITGVIMAAITAIVVLGGIRRIAEVATFLVPGMCVLYTISALYILGTNIEQLPAVFSLIISSAFEGQAAVGGFAGATVRSAMQSGIARGLMTNEAGLGSAPIVHAAAVTDHPIRQASYGIIGVFIDTLVVCMLSAFAVLSSGAWTSGSTGAALTAEAFSRSLPGEWGGIMVSIAIMLFAFSTIMGWSYYGETAMTYLFGVRVLLWYRIAWVLVVYLGSVGSLELVWSVSDTMNGLMAVPNLVAVLGSITLLRRQLREFFAVPR